MQASLKRSDLKAHIAKTAGDLFYREGIHAVGVDRVADAASVTKRTLYHHYASKDDLVAAALRGAPYIRFPQSGSPVERIAGAFERLGEFLTQTDYRGCPLIIFSAELVDRKHPARKIVTDVVERRRAWFARRAAEAGARDPDLLAEQLDVLFDGALASGVKRNNQMPARAASIAAKALVSCSLI